MANGRQGETSKARRVVIMLHSRCGVDRGALESLLKAAGVEEEIVFVEPETACVMEDLAGTTIVVPIDEAVEGAPDLEDGCCCAANGGGTVVVLISPGFDVVGMHRLAQDYGAQSLWRPDDLRHCLEGDGAERPSIGGSGGGDGWATPKAVKCGIRS